MRRYYGDEERLVFVGSYVELVAVIRLFVQISTGSPRWRFGRLCCLVRLSAEIFWTLACRNRASSNSRIAAVRPKLLSLHLITWLTPLSNADRGKRYGTCKATIVCSGPFLQRKFSGLGQLSLFASWLMRAGGQNVVSRVVSAV